MREITSDEVFRLRECVCALSAHHNRVSTHFRGSYPSRPYEETLARFEEALAQGASRIAVIEYGAEIVGFCKIDHCGESGKLDYLFVAEHERGRGYGKLLMDWAMAAFAAAGIHRIEVKVVDGNDAIHLYEKYGFRMNAHILVRSDETQYGTAYRK